MITKKLIIKGKVQGVGFRAATLREAQAINNLRGWVRNLPNGDVEAMIQGQESDVQALIKWCYQGPRFSRVDQVEVIDSEFSENFGPFGVRK